MRNLVSRMVCLVTLVWIAGVTGVHAQTASGEAPAVQQPFQTPAVLTPVPRVIWFNGAFHPADKRPVAAVETVTVAVYREREGGDAVWQETQVVTMEADGRYSLLMGSTSSDGMPLEVFTSGEPRWIGITVNRPGETEQPRVHLASVPYALKAADTETLGGKPASAYLLAEQKAPHASKHSTEAASTLTAGTPGYVGVFVDPANLGNSALYQSGVAIGLGTTVPLDTLHVAFTNSNGGATGYAVQNLSSAVNAYSGMLFYDQNGALGQFQGFNNSTHEYRINNVASGGTINFMIGTSKFLIANSGNIGVGVAVPLSKLDVAGGINTTSQYNIRGVRVLTSSVAGGNLSVGVGAGLVENADGNSFVGTNAGHINSGDNNSFFGMDAGFGSAFANDNSFFGMSAGKLTHDGEDNVFVGANAGSSNENGSGNTFVGTNSGLSIVGGTDNNNTFIGHRADGAAAISNATTIGFRASVTQSNSLVLGGITGVNGAIADTNVGIGTTAPKAKLHVVGGPVYIAQPHSLIITSPNGNCWFITVNNAGGLSSNLVTCPQ